MSPGRTSRRKHEDKASPDSQVIPDEDTDGQDASALGLEVVGRQLDIPKLALGVSGDAAPPRHRGPRVVTSPGSAGLAQQLQQISESYRVGLISSAERAALKEGVLSGQVRH